MHELRGVFALTALHTAPEYCLSQLSTKWHPIARDLGYLIPSCSSGQARSALWAHGRSACTVRCCREFWARDANDSFEIRQRAFAGGGAAAGSVQEGSEGRRGYERPAEPPGHRGTHRQGAPPPVVGRNGTFLSTFSLRSCLRLSSRVWVL